MDRSTAEKIVQDYDSLTAKAVEILNCEGPPWGYVFEVNFARLTFDGDDAVVRHPFVETVSNSTTVTTDTERFPAALLFMSPDDLALWKNEEKRKYDEERAKSLAVRMAKTEAMERAMYERLRRKFENR